MGRKTQTDEAAVEPITTEHLHSRWQCDDCWSLWSLAYEEGRDDEYRLQSMNIGYERDNEP